MLQILHPAVVPFQAPDPTSPRANIILLGRLFAGRQSKGHHIAIKLFKTLMYVCVCVHACVCVHMCVCACVCKLACVCFCGCLSVCIAFRYYHAPKFGTTPYAFNCRPDLPPNTRLILAGKEMQEIHTRTDASAPHTIKRCNKCITRTDASAPHTIKDATNALPVQMSAHHTRSKDATNALPLCICQRTTHDQGKVSWHRKLKEMRQIHYPCTDVSSPHTIRAKSPFARLGSDMKLFLHVVYLI